MATICALAKRGAEVHVVHWDHKKITPYQAPVVPNVYMYKRSELTADSILELARKILPSIIVVSGWMDKEYLTVAKQLRIEGSIVVCAFDGIWTGTLRQRVTTLLGCIGYFSQFFSHAWVAGFYQFEYARRLGFEKKKIVYDLYSADLNLFKSAYKDNLDEKRAKYPHRFLFVGRLEPIKGLDVLLKAWTALGAQRLDWDLHIVGNGSLKAEFESAPSVVIKDFMQPAQLMQEVADAGVLILSSRGEPWGVVVHEFAAAGLPLIVSDVVGAASTFLISGMNGYSYSNNNVQALTHRIRQIIGMTDQEILIMSANSHFLSQRITPETSAENILSIVN